MVNGQLTEHNAEIDAVVWECGPHANAWKGHDARCRQVPAERAQPCPNCGGAASWQNRPDGWRDWSCYGECLGYGSEPTNDHIPPGGSES